MTIEEKHKKLERIKSRLRRIHFWLRREEEFAKSFDIAIRGAYIELELHKLVQSPCSNYAYNED